MKKCIFSASIYIGKSHSLIHIFNNYIEELSGKQLFKSKKFYLAAFDQK